jgi:hypothetical protein
VPAPVEVPPHAPAITGSIHCELEKVKFPEFFGGLDSVATEAWWRTWRCASHFAIITPT